MYDYPNCHVLIQRAADAALCTEGENKMPNPAPLRSRKWTFHLTQEEKREWNFVNFRLALPISILTLVMSLVSLVLDFLGLDRGLDIRFAEHLFLAGTSTLLLFLSLSFRLQKLDPDHVPVPPLLALYLASVLVFELGHFTGGPNSDVNMLSFPILIFSCFLYFVVPPLQGILALGVLFAALYCSPYLKIGSFGLPDYLTLFVLTSFFLVIRYRYVTAFIRENLENRQLIEKQLQLNAKLDESSQQFKKLAETDFLTEVNSRAAAMTLMEESLKAHPEQKAVLAFIDIDEFKQINDLYGHETGDAALVSISAQLRKHFGKNCIFGRTGGDEFCVFLPGNIAANEAKILILPDIINTFRSGDKVYPCSLSVGFVEYPNQASDLQGLLKRADAALYQVKLHGKNGAVRFQEGMDKKERSQIGFSYRDLADNIPGAYFVFTADSDTEKILYANREMIELFRCSNLDDFLRVTGGSFRGLMLPDESPSVRAHVRDKASADPTESSGAVRCHIRTKDGKTVPVTGYSRLRQNPYYGDLFYMMLFREDKNA